MGNETFAGRVKMLRANKGLSLEGLANELKINKSRIGMWENNGTVPRDDVLIALSRYFDVSIDYLISGKEFQSKKKK